ncbi:MAG: tetrahydrofolate dehydrogenase/cyclohydrolase catalytic domain-containing protein [Mediterraneibacter gnavus]
MRTDIVSCKDYVEIKKKELKEEIRHFNRKPVLAVIQIDNNQASNSYIKGKQKDCDEIGIEMRHVNIYSNVVGQKGVECIIKDIAKSDADGIIIQLPIPDKYDLDRLQHLIPPEKDVDGFRKGSCFKPCTPKGIIDWMEYNDFEFKGKDCCVLGRSKIVGLPLTNMLIEKGATVTCCNSTTPSTWYYTRNADYAFSAVGVPNYFDFSDFQDFCELVVDIGINRDENGKLWGDVNNAGFESSLNDTYVTPVPGGVGLLTRLALMQNTLNAYKIQKTKG